MIVATKEIKKGDQIFINYSDTFWKSEKSSNEDYMGGEEEEIELEGEENILLGGEEGAEEMGGEISGDLEDKIFSHFGDDNENDQQPENIKEMSNSKGFPSRLDFDF